MLITLIENYNNDFSKLFSSVTNNARPIILFQVSNFGEALKINKEQEERA